MLGGATIRMWRRSLFVLIFLSVVCFSILILRLFNLQIFENEFLQKMAFNQQLGDMKISAQRGTIYDRNMNVLAQSASVWDVILEPNYIKDDETREIICTNLFEILGLEKEKLLEQSKKKSSHVIIKKGIESDTKDKIIKFKTDNKISGGIRLAESYKRYYPNGKLLAAVLGFVGSDNQGLAGLEAFYEKELKGEKGRILTAKNAVGSAMPFEYEQMIPSKNGYSLKLCVDENIQRIMEKYLEEGIITHKVMNRAAAISMDVNTGEILGLAVKGDFDPNEPFKLVDSEEEKRIEGLPEGEKAKAKAEALQKQWRNKAVSDTYYPGSTFKMVIASMALELGVVDESSSFNCSGSIVPYPGAGRSIRCHKRGGHGGGQSFLKALCNSCNPAFITIGQRIGPENFFNYYKAFGFHEKTRIDLPGESDDLFFKVTDGKLDSLMDLATGSIGQNFGITPIQMLRAACAIANGGKIVRPHIVKEILDEKGNIVKSIDPEIIKTAISEETSRKITEMLQENAISGAARNAYVPGLRVAGKTGTSQKIGLSMVPGIMDYISSFCGFAPADNPKIATLVYFDTPKGQYYYGSAVAAPVFAKIMSESLPYLGIERVYTEEEYKHLDSTVPSFIGKKTGEAKNEVQSIELRPIVVGKGETVISQLPDPSSRIPKGSAVILYTDESGIPEKVKVPKLTDLTIGEANRIASNARLNIKITGTNLSDPNLYSLSQSIAEGEEVQPGTVITVNFIVRDGAT